MSAPPKSPLKLVSYLVEELSFKAQLLDQSLSAADVEVLPEHLEIQHDLVQRESSVLDWVVVLTVELKDEAGKSFPYVFKVKMFGFFEVSENYPEDGREQLVHTSGLSVLYSMARDIVKSTTERGPYVGVFLPTVNFWIPRVKPEDATQAELL